MDFQQKVLLQQLGLLAHSLSTTVGQVEKSAKDIGNAKSALDAKTKAMMIEGYLITVKQEIADIETRLKVVDSWKVI